MDDRGTWLCYNPRGGKESNNNLATEQQQQNQVEICALSLPHKFYFLVGYGETLSHFYNCPVPLQIVPSKVMYIYDNHLLEGLGEDKW